jgi:hypothetical protein
MDVSEQRVRFVVTADLVDSSACLLAQIGRNFLFVDRHPE